MVSPDLCAFGSSCFLDEVLPDRSVRALEFDGPAVFSATGSRNICIVLDAGCTGDVGDLEPPWFNT